MTWGWNKSLIFPGPASHGSVAGSLSRSSQGNENVVLKLNEIKLLPYYNIKNSYYAIINENKQHIISCASTQNNNKSNKISSVISIYKYDDSRNFIVEKERDINKDFGYHINLMNFFKNYENYYLILMSEFDIEIINLDNNNDSRVFYSNLKTQEDLRFTYIEPAFTREIIVGYNNGDVELINPFWEDNKMKKLISNKYKPEKIINKLIKQISNNDISHQSSVIQIKISDYYPLYVSIADEMILYQLKDN